MNRILRDCPSPAKLNLFLHVIGQRADGYHLLQTVFQLLDYGDLLHFITRSDTQIRRITEVENVPHDTDLIVRAARLLQNLMYQRDKNTVCGVDIEIDKKIPMGGGLGGGSSNAATTLMALNHLWQCGFTRQELMDLGKQLGADVPFFLFGQNAFAEGIGEILTPLETPKTWYVVINPGIVVPTPVIFQSKELTRNTEPIRISDFPGDYDTNAHFGKNDLQAVATRHFHQIDQAIQWLCQFGTAKMTGSGACVFASFKSEADANKVLDALPSNFTGFKAKAIQVHPLHSLV